MLPLAIGFSNGAIMAAALLMTYPDLFAGAILFRPLSPFARDLPSRLDGKPVLIIDGSADLRRSTGDGLRLAGGLRRLLGVGHASTALVGHSITGDDRTIAREWLRSFRS